VPDELHYVRAKEVRNLFAARSLSRLPAGVTAGSMRR
jgi:hypothetical protein